MNVEISRRLLVVGARMGSLGGQIANTAGADYDEWDRITAADQYPDKNEPNIYGCDVTDRKQVVNMLDEIRPTDIICCVGVNLPDGEVGEIFRNWTTQMQVNAYGPTLLMGEAIDMWNRSMLPPPSGFNFVAVSSNSAHVARSTSAGYCASKAALSMTMRSVARRIADTAGVMRVWGYEPGFINDTPMSQEVRMRLKPNVPPHRIPGGRGLERRTLAQRILRDVSHADRSLNGCMFRVDGGEQ